MGCNDDDVSKVSSEVEHQTANLAVAGSTPVPNRRLERVGSTGRESVHHEARGRWSFVRSAAVGLFRPDQSISKTDKAGRSRTVIGGQTDGGSMNRGHVVCGYRGCGSPTDGGGNWPLRVGPCTSTHELVKPAGNRRPRLLKQHSASCACDRRAYRRPKAFFWQWPQTPDFGQ